MNRSLKAPRARSWLRSSSSAALSALTLGALVVACTPNKRRPPKEEKPAAQAQPQVVQAQEAAPISVAVAPFVGPEGEAGWLGVLVADHVTRRLQVKSMDGPPPLYVLGWRQTMAAARSIELESSEVPKKASELLVELGADALVMGSYAPDGEGYAIQWQIARAEGEGSTGTLSGPKSATARTAYELGGKVLAELAPGVELDEGKMSRLAAVGAGQAWGEALLRLARQSRDPRATVVLDDEEVSEVLARLETVTQTNGDFAPAWAMRATVASMGFEPEEEVAMSAAKAAMNLGKADPSAAISLYYMHQQLAEQTKAREMLEQALKTYPGSLEVLNYLAQAHYLASNHEKTLEIWNDYLERVPKSAHAARRRDTMLSRLGRHEEAVTNAKVLVEQHPGSVPTLAALASRQIDAGKMEDAKATLTDALKEHPDHPLLLTRLSFVELEGGSSNQALILAKKAVERIGDGRGEPLAGYAHIDLARAQALSGDRETAKKTLREALRLGVGGDDIVRLANDPRLEGFITLPLVLEPE